MRISEGNIFEAMRLVLPEHRERMSRFEREAHKAEQPSLSPDKERDIHFTLEAAIRNSQPIRVTLFNPYENETLTGTPSFRNGKLFLTNETGVHVIARARVVNIEEA